jgi:hypothetical protein
MACATFYAQGGAFSLPQPTTLSHSPQAPILRLAPTPKGKTPGKPGGWPLPGATPPRAGRGGRARAGRWEPGAASSTNPPPPGGSPVSGGSGSGAP